MNLESFFFQYTPQLPFINSGKSLSIRRFVRHFERSAEKQMLKAISFVIEQRKNEFDRIEKVEFPSCIFALRGWCQFPDTCQDLFVLEKTVSEYLWGAKLAEGVISKVIKTS